MAKSVFDFDDYRDYLRAAIAEKDGKGRGFRSHLADQIGCQRTFISQVLKGDVHFNLEHGDKVSQVLGHRADEADFFLNLILLARAGTHSLKARFREQIKAIRERRKVLKNRFREKEALRLSDQVTYYSSWHYAAIRVLVTIPGFQNRSAIQKRLRLGAEEVNAAVEFLLSRGLLAEDKHGLKPTLKYVYLGSDSPLISKHHTNWRLRAMGSLEREKKGDLHFSAVYSLTAADAEKLRELLADALERLRNTARASKEEVLYGACLDFFEI